MFHPSRSVRWFRSAEIGTSSYCRAARRSPPSGSEASAIAYTLLVLALTENSPGESGARRGSRACCRTGCSRSPAGVAVDRFNRRSLMIWGGHRPGRGGLGSLGVTIVTGHVTFEQIVAVAFVEGTMFVIFNIAEIGAVRSVVAEAAIAARLRGRASAVGRPQNSRIVACETLR